MSKQSSVSKAGGASQVFPAQPLASVAAERALRDLRSLWLVPTLILTVLVALLLAFGKSPSPVFDRPIWLTLTLVIFVIVYGFVHRRAMLLARTLRAQAARETTRWGQDIQRAEARMEEQLLLATLARDFSERILQNVPAAVLVLDAGDDFLIRSANALAEAMPDPDRQHDGLPGRRLGDVFPGLDALLAEPLRRAAQGNSVTLPDVAYGALTRGVTYWTFSLTPQRDSQTRHVAQVIVLAVETTDRIRLLRERERHAEESDRYARVERHRARELEATLTSLSDGVILCDASGHLVSANRAAQSILGPGAVEPGESVETWSARIGFCYPSGQPVPPGAMPLNLTLRDGHVTERAEFLLSGGETPCVIELTSAPVVSPDPEARTVGAVAVLRDVTELRRSRRLEAVATARVGALVQISRRLNATLDENEIHAIVTEGALALLPESDMAGTRALLYGREDADTLTLLRTTPEEGTKRPRSQQQALPLILPFHAKSPLLWSLYVQRQSVISRQVAVDPHFAGDGDRRLLQGASPRPPEVLSAIVLPLVAGDVVTGHLLLTGLGADTFDDPQLQDALTNLAALATIARANARLYAQTRQRADELDALWTVGQAVVSQTHLRDVADTLTERVQAVFGAGLCTLSLWETMPGGDRHLRWQGTRHDDALMPEPDGGGLSRLECGLCDMVTRQTAEGGEIVTRLGVTNPPFGCCRWRAFSGQSGTHSVLSAPLRQGDDTLGALTVFRAGSIPFAPDQVKLLRTLAALAVTAVRNAQNFAYEHRISQTLQKAWLPDHPPLVPGLSIAASYTPARTEEAQIGGDYYDFLPLDARRLAFFIGDISGKGLSAAVHTALAKYTLRAFAAQGMSPQEVVTRTNTVMMREMGREVFSTLFYGVWDAGTKALTYVNAGHEPPQWLTADGRFSDLKGTGPVLGAFADSAYEQVQVTLQVGDILAVYTDGLSECRNEQQTFFGETGIQAALLAEQGQNAVAIVATLSQAALDFTSDHRLHDDVALLVLRITGEDALSQPPGREQIAEAGEAARIAGA